jgi:hypothetical protein
MPRIDIVHHAEQHLHALDMNLSLDPLRLNDRPTEDVWRMARFDEHVDLSQDTPASHQRPKRRCTVFQQP